MKSIAKILFAILLLLTATTSANAQKLTVESMTMEPMDLSASKYSRTDLNGKACALVKVQIPLEGMVFEGNVMGNVENKAGEYWVYLTAGTKFFKIKHRSVMPLFLTFADYGLEPLSARTTYVVRLSAPASAPETDSNAIVVDPVFEIASIKAEAKETFSNGDYKQALELYLKISDDPEVQNRIAEFYFFGYGVKQNFIESARWYHKAAEHDVLDAQIMMGNMYIDGIGVIQNYDEAARWYLKATERGDLYAQFQLGKMYYEGKGVDQNRQEAYRLMKKAADAGYSKAKKFISKHIF